MKRALLVTLGMGVGWVLSATILMILVPLKDYTPKEILFNYLIIGFPGIVLFMISIILALMNPEGLEGKEY